MYPPSNISGEYNKAALIFSSIYFTYTCKCSFRRMARTVKFVWFNVLTENCLSLCRLEAVLSVLHFTSFWKAGTSKFLTHEGIRDSDEMWGCC